MAARLSGSHAQRMDEKSRLAIPAKLLPELRQLSGVGGEEELNLVVSVTVGGRLGIYTLPHYERMVAEAEAASPHSVEAEELLSTYMIYRHEQCPDKQHRIRIPQEMAELFNLSGEVYVMGCGEYLEVVNRNDWKEMAKLKMERMAANKKAVHEWHKSAPEKQ